MKAEKIYITSSNLIFMNGAFRTLAMMKGAGVIFPFTVEKMAAIVEGLQPKKGEDILAICGCGDQAFALLEKGAKVTVVDVNPSQIELLKRRKAALERDSFSDFYGTPTSTHDFPRFRNRMEYFESELRYQKLVELIGNLDIVDQPTSLESICAKRKFDKIYASDAISELYSPEGVPVHLAKIVKGLRKNGLIYISNGSEIANLVPDLASLGIRLHEKLTKRAEENEDVYRPDVYVKD